MAKKKASKWKYVTPKERTLASVSTLAGLSALGVGLSFVFSPLALGIAGGVVLMGQISQVKASYKKRWIKKLVSKGTLSAVPAHEPAALIAAEISGQLGRKEPPKIYTMRKSTTLGYFFSVPGANTILTNQASLDKMSDPDELRFVIAHEMAHLKTDGRAGIGLNIIPQTIRGLALAGIVTLIGAVVGVSAPFLAGGIGVLGFTALAAIPVTRAALKFNSRIRERRADRNALYITRDLNSGIKALDHLGFKTKRHPSLRKEAFLSHPSYDRRIRSMTKAFNKKVAKAPKLPPPVNLVVKKPPELQNGAALRC